MSLYEKLLERKEKLALVGLGYVGMPIAIAFSKNIDVIGFDLNKEKIELYNRGIDPTNEVGNSIIRNSNVLFTSDEERLKEAKFFIVAVPTPINQDKTPDLSPLESASRLLGRNITQGSIVVFESTVYPGVTEDVCVPIIEEASGLVCGRDFKVGYSPERINPGDKIHRLENIKKIVSGMDEEALAEIKNVYDIVIDVGTYPVSSIKTAEAIKVMENSQRDINIAFVNEMAKAFNKMGIDTNEVVDGMNTKWNALGFRPGLVGGHCISVDPYYFTYEAEKKGYHSQIVLAGRYVNDSMGEFIGDEIVKMLIKNGYDGNANIVIMGVTFKENCPDTRNTKVFDIINKLKEYNIIPKVCDPWLHDNKCIEENNLSVIKMDDIKDMDCIVFAVAHNEFSVIDVEKLKKMYKKDGKRILIDIKNLYKREEVEKEFVVWRL